MPGRGPSLSKKPSTILFFHRYIAPCRKSLLYVLSNDKKRKKKYQEKEEIEEARRESVKVCLKFPEGNKKSFSLRCALFLFIHLLRSVSSYILFVGLSLYQTEGWG